jgi:hypothetical protein
MIPLLKIQAVFTGYEGKPCTTFTGVSEVEGVGPVLLMIEYRERPMVKIDQEVLLVTDTHGSDHDMLFRPEDLLEALEIYRDLSRRKIFEIDDPTMQRLKPDSAFEIDGLNPNGKQNLNFFGLSNGQAAVLATCLMFKKQQGLSNAQDMISRMTSMFLTI